MIDFSKPVETRDGFPVRIICTDGPDAQYPIIGVVEEETHIRQWTTSGIWARGTFDGRKDLVQAAPRINQTVWINVFAPEHSFTSREDADFRYYEYIHSGGKAKRIACVPVKVSVEEGTGL